MSKAAVFRQASEDFNTELALEFGHVRLELGEKVWASMLAENKSYPAGREATIWWRCQDAGWVE